MNIIKRSILIFLILGGLMGFKKTKKQVQAVNLIAENTTTLLEGGGRSGKTVIALNTEVVRSLNYPNSWHLAARLRFNHAKTSLWQKTLPDILKFHDLHNAVKYNHTDCYIEFPNGSRIIVGGLDDKNRVEKILGNEYATIFLNEASQIEYDSVETVKTRLNALKGIPLRFLIDYNPPSKKHWGYQIFHERKFPDGRPVPKDDYGVIRMNPEDNIENISELYIEQLKTLSGRKLKRFYHGEYGDEEGTLWKRAWFNYMHAPIDLDRVAVGVDPSGSKNGDEIGIIVAGKKDDKYYVLADYSLHGTPKEWRDEVIAAYENNKADIVSAEKNYGGEMVESTITDFGKNQVNVKLVNATRGKVVRAEPISALYEKGMVYHIKSFPALEDELCTTRFEDLKESPNRLDALVWAITELAEEGELKIRYV